MGQASYSGVGLTVTAAQSGGSGRVIRFLCVSLSTWTLKENVVSGFD